jgi:hypothetical protein
VEWNFAVGVPEEKGLLFPLSRFEEKKNWLDVWGDIAESKIVQIGTRS